MPTLRALKKQYLKRGGATSFSEYIQVVSGMANKVLGSPPSSAVQQSECEYLGVFWVYLFNLNLIVPNSSVLTLFWALFRSSTS